MAAHLLQLQEQEEVLESKRTSEPHLLQWQKEVGEILDQMGQVLTILNLSLRPSTYYLTHALSVLSFDRRLKIYTYKGYLVTITT